ncbi:hypothetical protein BGX12_1296 [Fibrobacter sp. UWR4]|nr:hypothetical protein BGX12_1296 [Fibrobacter sp. UWR4]PZW66072.1 hypothetical protein C8E88_10296 [Fibrobacter sp. UWR1]
MVLCALVLVALFFPFTFWMHGELNARGAKAWGFFFRKKMFEVEKTFGDDEDVESFSASPAASAPVANATAEEDNSTQNGERNNASQEPPETFRADADAAVGFDGTEGKKEKRSLTETEFWSILLTPEFDAKAWWAVKKLLVGLCRLCHLKFINCFVEGIRTDYARMGELASLNAFLKSYPYIGDWDFRMDWTQDHELRGEGHVRLRVNLCRFIGLLMIILFYGGIVLFSFWRRRAHVLKTNELPELGWIRTKIVKMMAEE